MKTLSKGGGAGPMRAALLTAGGVRLVTADGQFIYGEGITVPTSIHDYMPFRYDLAQNISIDTPADSETDPTNWVVAHDFQPAGNLVAGQYRIVYQILWSLGTTSDFAFFKPRVNNVETAAFMREEPKDQNNIMNTAYSIVRDHAGGAFQAELLALTEDAADPVEIYSSTIQIERVA